MRFLLLLIIFSTSCYDPCFRGITTNWGQKYYDINTESEVRTPKHRIRVDLSGQHFEEKVLQGLLKQIDNEVDWTYECLSSGFNDNNIKDIRQKAYCYTESDVFSLNTECLVVKIVDDCRISEIDGRMMLDDETPCDGKSETDKTRTCYWQSKLQDGVHIVVCPNLWNFRDPLVKYITGCEYHPGDDRLERCAWGEKRKE